jgi:aspartate aminotransferase-like enzyme
LVPGDRVLSIATGVFGDGIADMAAAVGADVSRIRLDYDKTVSDMKAVEAAIVKFKPKMITAVHCETPSGTLNPVADVGRIKTEQGVPLFYVDAVASIGGTPVLTDQWHIDLCLGASQKCLSSLPDAAFVSISDVAWEIIDRVDYAGYDALKPFRSAKADMYFPYTPNWHAMAGLDAALALILSEGLENCFSRHEQTADYCRGRLKKLGLRLFPSPDAVASPTVTAAYVPEGVRWEVFDARLRAGGLVTGGSFGPLAGRVFRLGHMGSQADMKLVARALDVVEEVITAGWN